MITDTHIPSQEREKGAAPTCLPVEVRVPRAGMGVEMRAREIRTACPHCGSGHKPGAVHGATSTVATELRQGNPLPAAAPFSETAACNPPIEFSALSAAGISGNRRVRPRSNSSNSVWWRSQDGDGARDFLPWSV